MGFEPVGCRQGNKGVDVLVLLQVMGDQGFKRWGAAVRFSKVLGFGSQAGAGQRRCGRVWQHDKGVTVLVLLRSRVRVLGAGGV